MSTDAKFAISMIFFLIVGVIGMGVYANHLEDQVTHYKEQVQDEHTHTIEVQLKYEEARDEKAQLERDLADRDERLAEAAERERAAKVRASRSRRQGPTSTGKAGPNLGVGVPISEGSLRDITMYCPTGNTTASGKWPQRGMVATMERSIPFGTHIVIEGLGSFVVEDRIGSGSEFDVFTNSCSEADQFGRQHRRVTILN